MRSFASLLLHAQSACLCLSIGLILCLLTAQDRHQAQGWRDLQLAQAHSADAAAAEGPAGRPGQAPGCSAPRCAQAAWQLRRGT